MVRQFLRVVALTCGSALLVAAPAGASWLKPTAPVSGHVRVSWTSTAATLWGPSTVEGAVRFDVVGRASSPGALTAWAPLEIAPRDVDRARRFFGFYLRARTTVERYTAVLPGQVCADGQAPSETVTSVGPVIDKALLDTFEPRLDLVRRRGIVDVDLEAPGTFRLRTTGTGCVTPDDSQISRPGPIAPGEQEVAVSTMLGTELIRRINGQDELPVKIAGDRSFTVRTTRAFSLDVQGERARGSITFDLRFAGPPPAQSGLCALPTTTEVRRLRTAADVQRLARRRGFSRIVVGAPKVRGPFDRGARYRFAWESPEWPCGQSLGTRKAPSLVPLTRAP